MAINETAYIDTLFIIQEIAIQLTTGNKWNSHTGTLFKHNNILTLSDINSFQVDCFGYQALHGNLPEYFNKYFVTNQSMDI